MTGKNTLRRSLQLGLLGLGLVVGLALTGCQTESGGQTLPSPYYMNDDVQYFAPASQMKLQQEADAMKAFKEQQAQQQAASR
jgi:hypothetical protein